MTLHKRLRADRLGRIDEVVNDQCEDARTAL